MKNKGGRGFTLVELLIVIVVIAILASIATLSYRGMKARALTTRAEAEMSALAKATLSFKGIHERYPNDVDRNIPAEIAPYIDGTDTNWPTAPWPNSVYDYDYFTGSDGKEVAQISVRFCPINGPLSQCNFPSETWANGFGVNSSAYWCITGKCRAHQYESDTYPAYCINCH